MLLERRGKKLPDLCAGGGTSILAQHARHQRRAKRTGGSTGGSLALRKPLRPAALAAYSARSARRDSTSSEAGCSAYATPTLSVAFSSLPSHGIERVIEATMRSATRFAVAGVASRSITIA